MGQSNYPGSLDSGQNIPAVRNNILDVGPDVINSLRSAVFQIERALGISPNGVAGNNLADRLSVIIDPNGNLLPSAIASLNLLSGPILNSDVSASANISESKINLTFPTPLLQSEIQDNQLKIDLSISQINNLISLLSAHTAAIQGRHFAADISVPSTIASAAATSANSIPTGSVQSILESIFNGHINFDGANTSQANFSHNSNQLYYNNSGTSLSSGTVEGAISELSVKSSGAQSSHQTTHHSNGIGVSGLIQGSTSGFGDIIKLNTPIAFGISVQSSESKTLITMLVPFLDYNKIDISDIIEVIDTNDLSGLYTGVYQVASITRDSNGLVTSLYIFGKLRSNSSSLTVGSIYKREFINQSKTMMLTGLRQRAGLTSANVVQVCNPDSTYVKSSGFSFGLISSTSRYFSLTLDSDPPVIIDVYDGTVLVQSAITVIKKINEICAEKALNALAYIDKSNGQEIVIAHNVPNSSTAIRTITLSTVTDSGLSSLGFSFIDGISVSTPFGSEYFIEGSRFEGLGLKLSMGPELSFFSGTTVIQASAGIDFISRGVSKDDLIIIDGSGVDNGTYSISSVSSSQLVIDSAQLISGFSGSSSASSVYKIYNNSSSFFDQTFVSTTGSFGAILSDVFMDSSQNIFSSVVFEYQPVLSGTSPLFSISAYSGKILSKNYFLTVELLSGNLLVSIDNGEKILLDRDKTRYEIKSAEGISISIDILNLQSLLSEVSVSTNSSITTTLFGSKNVSSDTNLLLSSIAYLKFDGTILGDIKDLRPFGITGINDVSSQFISDVIEHPRSELRSCGVISGSKVLSVSIGTNNNYELSYDNGVILSNGKRVSIKSGILYTGIDSTVNSKIFIKASEFGEIVADIASVNCISPFGGYDLCPLAIIENNGVSIDIIDTRLFLNEIDLKSMQGITVSPQIGMGHFNDIRSAIRYAKRFSELYPKSGVPHITIKPGTYNVNSIVSLPSLTLSDIVGGITNKDTVILDQIFEELLLSNIFIDFPLMISGVGDCNLRLTTEYQLLDGNVSEVGGILISGAGFIPSVSSNYTNLNSGNIKISNLNLINSNIVLADTLSFDSAGIPVTSSIQLDSLTFDFSTVNDSIFFSVIDTGAVEVREFYNQVDRKGNLTVNGCKFIDSRISVFNSPGLLKNILVSNNTQTTITQNTLSSTFFNKDLLDFSLFAQTSNIDITNNIRLDDNLTTGIVPIGKNMAVPSWGDRSGRDSWTGDTTYSGNFKYLVPKTIGKTLLWNTSSISDIGPQLSGILYINPTISTIGSNKLLSVLIPQNNSVNTPINDSNQGISSVILGVTSGPPVASIWSVSIVEAILSSGTFSILFQSNTISSSPSSTVQELTFSIPAYTRSPGAALFVNIKQTGAINSAVHYYTRIETTSKLLSDLYGAS